LRAIEGVLVTSWGYEPDDDGKIYTSFIFLNAERRKVCTICPRSKQTHCVQRDALTSEAKAMELNL